MKFKVSLVKADDYIKKLSELAYVASFGENRPSSLERFDFAIVAEDQHGEISGFITCKEMDSETLYWQHGGSLPNYAKTSSVMSGYMAFLMWTKERYKRVTTRIENINLAMIKLALHVGFLIVGTVTVKNKTYLELVNEF